MTHTEPMQHTEDSLTTALYQHCKNQNIPAVVGASISILFTALASVDSPEIRRHFATTLREMADRIENYQPETLQ